uniref:Septin-type G domain-containing protein n=1 Tax=Hucho hucho TaxID=62062 RepID=A0A4W5KJ74_9TELE
MASSSMTERQSASAINSEYKPRSKLLHADIINDCKQTSPGPPTKYLLMTEKEILHDSENIRRWTFGKKDPSKINRTILMMGETGSGKSTLINVMVNYILGVEWEDKYRFEIIADESKSQTSSQTTAITVYEIFGHEDDHLPFSLTIIDTPGFGDTSGIEQDKLITKNLQELFQSPKGVHHIDAVCFVVKAAQVRLTSTQRYIFDSVLSIFGKDIENNIVALSTFADSGEPLVLQALVMAEVPCVRNESGTPVYFKFNNVFAGLQMDEDDEEHNDEEEEEENDEVCQSPWKMSMKNMAMFFKSLNTMEAKSLVLTRQVLEKRKQLEMEIQTLTKQLQVAMQRVEALRRVRDQLEQHEEDMEANRIFSILLDGSVKEKCAVNKKATNCNSCRETCHHPCREYFGCTRMQQDRCTVCIKKCSWNDHCKEKFIYVFKTEEGESTYLDLKRKYEELEGQLLTAKMFLMILIKELHLQLIASFILILKILSIVQKLDEIALRPNPMSAAKYLELLIEKAQRDHNPERVKTLTDMKEQEKLKSNFANLVDE